MPKRADVGLLVVVTVVVIAAAIAVAAQPSGRSSGGTGKYYIMFGKGSLHINDAGRSHGGFEYAAEYNVTCAAAGMYWVRVGDTTDFHFSLSIGLGDVLQVHSLRPKIGYLPSIDAILLSGAGYEIKLIKVNEDLVWDHKWDGYYIASWGGDAPEEEIRGEISPLVFGLPEHYYVELRLWAQVMAVSS